MAFDDRGRLWVLCMPTYPQLNPLEGAPNDKLVILEDTDGDGDADTQEVFADGLHVPTGFEIGDGGAYVAAQPNLLFIRDGERRVILHGFGTEDSHHAISAFTWTPGGALCFQEGTFFHTQVETPWGPTRLRDAGVFRYEPRTQKLRVLVSYPFANPWGHVYDAWGQNFVADASGGSNYFAAAFSGHVDYPRKHAGMKEFTDTRVRPTAGCEFVSSRAWPDEVQGRWLLTNVIGFRGILQFRLEDDGSGLRAEKVGELLKSSDPNFRPVAVRFGPDGALYVADWHNPLIGHMQYSIRDPRRDRTHGRIWRVTYRGRTIAPENPAGMTVERKLELLKSPEDRTRYRARRSLRGDDIAPLAAWVERQTDEHALLEALWVYQHHNVLNRPLLERLLGAKDHRARAAAVRVARFMCPELVPKIVDDPHPRVRLEAVVALSDQPGVEAALGVLRHPTDYYIDYALRELLRNREAEWTAQLRAGKTLCADNPAGAAYLLDAAPPDGLASLPPSEAVHRSMLTREGVPLDHRLRALAALGDPALALLSPDAGKLLARSDTSGLDLGALADAPETRVAAYAGWLPADEAWEHAQQSAARLLDALRAVPMLKDPTIMQVRIAPLVEKAPSGGCNGRYVRVELPGAKRTLSIAEVEVFGPERLTGTATMSSTSWEGPPEKAIDGNTDGEFKQGHSLAHSEIDVADPWWELDLGAERRLDRVVIWNATGSQLASRLDGFRLRVLDAERRTVFISTDRLDVDLRVSETAIRRAAIEATSAPDGLEVLMRDARFTEAALRTLRRLGVRPAGLDEFVDGMPLDRRLEPAYLDAAAILGRGEDVMSRGRAVYAEHCARCHQPDGRGLPGAFPPLAGSDWLDLDEQRAIEVVLHGLSGAIQVSGAAYDAEMPPFAATLSDRQVADVVTFIRNSWGNRGPEVRPEQVSRDAADMANPWRDHPRRAPPHVVFVTGDEEYRSEESMPMLAKILARDYGFRVSVCYSLAADGTVDPNNVGSIGGLEALADADLMVMFTRFRQLPEHQIQRILEYKGPRVGFRTATHAFRYPAEHPRAAEMNEAWPERVFGQKWITHHGHFGDGHEFLTDVQPIGDHPILRGVEPFKAYSWLYHVEPLSGDSAPLAEGTALKSSAKDFPKTNPVAWTKTHDGERVFFMTTAHPYDFKDASARRLALNGILWALGIEVPEGGARATPVGFYEPNNSGFGDKYKAGLVPELLPETSWRVGADEMKIHGSTLQVEEIGGERSLGYWTDAADSVELPARPGRWRVRVWFACTPESAGAEIDVGGARWTVPSTGSWQAFEWAEVGVVTAGATLSIRAVKKPGVAVMNLRAVEFVSAE